MFFAYLVAAIVGGVLLAASVLTGGHHGGGGGGGHLLGDGHTAGQDVHAHTSSSPMLFVFSLRLWTYLLAFGGATGLILRSLVGTSEPMAALLAAVVGVGAGTLAQTIIPKMGAGELGGTVQQSQLVGKLGQLLLPIANGSSSKVRVTVENRTIDMIATGEDEFAAGEEVLLVEVKDGIAVVAKSPLVTGGPARLPVAQKLGR